MPEDVVELHYDTWGSYGQFRKTVAVLRDGTVVDPAELARHAYRGQSKTVRIGGTEVRVVNNSSRKNFHITVYVPRSAVLAVISLRRSSSGLKPPEIVEGEGEIREGEEVKEEEGDRYLVRRRYRVWYYVGPGGVTAPIYRLQVGYERELKGKPLVEVVYFPHSGTIVVQGDTYHVRDVLKKLRFRWDWVDRVWRKYGTEEEARRVAEALKEIADVEYRVPGRVVTGKSRVEA